MFGALQLEGCGFESTSKPPRRDPGQVLHSQLLMRFGVKLRLSVRAVVGSASEWEICEGRYNKCSNTIQYNTYIHTVTLDRELSYAPHINLLSRDCSTNCVSFALSPDRSLLLLLSLLSMPLSQPDLITVAHFMLAAASRLFDWGAWIGSCVLLAALLAAYQNMAMSLNTCSTFSTGSTLSSGLRTKQLPYSLALLTRFRSCLSS